MSSTDQRLYSTDRLIFMARMHRKVIDYYQFVLEELKSSDQERSRIVGYILREERALADIGQLAGLRTTEMTSDLPLDLTTLENAIEEP